MPKFTQGNSGIRTGLVGLIGWYAVQLLAWVAVWVIFDAHLRRLEPVEERIWWESTKLCLWVAPLLYWARVREGLSWGEVLAWPAPDRPILTRVSGMLILGWTVILAIEASFVGIRPAKFDLEVLRVITWSPLVEELVFRGLVFDGLRRRGLGLWSTSTATAVAFAGIHVVGWTFMHDFPTALTMSVSLVPFGIVLGLMRAGQASLFGPLLLHALHNAWIQGVIPYAWQIWSSP